MVKRLFLAFAVVLLSAFAAASRADEAPPFVYNEGLFESAAKVKFVQRAANIKEWQISHASSGVRSANIVFQESSGGQTYQEHMSIRELFKIMYDEELTSDADQDPQPRLVTPVRSNSWVGR